jgi:ketosteroid isomerase-like protein
MSEENVAFVRAVMEAFPRVQAQLRAGELPIHERVAEDVEWDASELGAPDLGDGRLRGHEGVRRFWSVWLAAWDDTVSKYELHATGDHVVCLITLTHRTAEREMTLPLAYAQVWTFDAGRLIRWKLYRDHREALESVGLAP